MAALEVQKHGLPGHYIHPTMISDVELSNSTPKQNNSHDYPGNKSLDVTIMNCFDNYDTLACTRTGMMTGLVMITGLLCMLKLCRLHCRRFPSHHQYVIFYAAAFECLLCSVHWILASYARLELIVQWLKLVQLLAVSHLYWIIVSRVHCKEHLTKGLVMPIYILSFIYITVAVTLGCVFTKSSWIECFEPYWLWLSAAELVLVQLFTVAAVYIMKRLNEISTLDSVRREQRRDICLLVVFFELSALCSFTYDLVLRIMADEEEGCSGAFYHSQEIYTPIYGSFMIVKFLLPIWGMLFVFHPVDTSHSDHNDMIAQSEDGNYASIFRPAYTRSLYRPINYVTGDFNVEPPEAENSPFSGGSSSTGTTPIFGPARRPSSRRASELHSTSTDNDNVVDVSDRRLML